MSKVSILTASYNYENCIKKAIDSVINQSYSNWELIIVDDGSKDNSVEIIQEYTKKDNRIKLYTHKNKINKGLSETLKLGLEKAKGEYITFLEADDFIKNDYLIKKLKIFGENPEIGLIYNDVELFGDNKVILKREKYLNKIRDFWKNNNMEMVNDAMHLFNLIPTFSCVMLKKDLLKDCDFNSPLKEWLDWWLWVQTAKKTKLFYIDEKLTYWQMHSQSYICREEANLAYYKKAYNFKKLIWKILPKIKSPKFKKSFFIKRIKQILLYETDFYKIYFRIRSICE